MSKLYIASISARHDNGTEHYPILLSEKTPEAAVDRARSICAEKWRHEDLWTEHHIVVIGTSVSIHPDPPVKRTSILEISDDPGEYQLSF
jgi:hypothetical protein